MKMAGIVASTLRRRTFRQKHTVDARYQAIEPGHISLSPSGSRPNSRSSSFSKEKEVSERVPKAAKLHYEDFWPQCLNPMEQSLRLSQFETFDNYEDFWPQCVNPMEQSLRLSQFETFDTLIPKANAWLQEHMETFIIKCETVEKKICSADDVTSDNPLFITQGNYAIYVKGLRLWYIHDYTLCRKSTDNVIPIEVGYMNVIPKCLDSSRKYPLYETLPDTYEAINAYLSDTPMEGKILTIETVSLKLPHRHWEGPEVNPDKTYFPDEYHRHVLYITRIFFIYGPPEEEFIGAQDFLPDFIAAARWYTIYGIYPKYRHLVTAMHKVKEWLESARNIRVTNVQTLEAVFKQQPENVHTGVNFVDKVESCAMIRFVRVTYVRPQNDATECLTMYAPPTGFSYKTFIPAAVKVGMCSGAPEYETLAQTWERAKTWLKCIDRRIISVETFYHTLSKIWHDQDLAESTVMSGEWTSNERGERSHKTRRPIVHMIRVYLDGDYSEPPASCLPPSPMVEEVNDCKCTIM